MIMLFLVTSKERAMHTGKILFAQLVECLPWYQFNECVRWAFAARYGRARWQMLTINATDGCSPIWREN